jgi:hypothetical protein
VYVRSINSISYIGVIPRTDGGNYFRTLRTIDFFNTILKARTESELDGLYVREGGGAHEIHIVLHHDDVY